MLCVCVYVCTCVCVCTSFCYLLGTFSSTNTDLVKTNWPHGDHSLVLITQNVFSEVLVKVRDMMWIVVRLKLGLGMNG